MHQPRADLPISEKAGKAKSVPAVKRQLFFPAGIIIVVHHPAIDDQLRLLPTMVTARASRACADND
jgi:hypothetical protein